MMDDVDLWIYLGGPEPASLKPLLDAMRELPPLSPEDNERLGRGVMERIDEARSRRSALSASGERRLRPSQSPVDAPISEEEPRTAPDTARVVSEQGPTARSPSFDAPVYPWPSPAPGPRRPSVEVRAASAPEFLKITEPLPELPPALRAQRSPLPFEPAPPAPASPSAPASPPAPKTRLDAIMKVPVKRPVGADTFPIGDTSRQRAMAVLPFVGSTAGTGLVAFPRLTIEQYASFQVELSLWPERSAQIYHRYRVANEAARVALDEHWKSHFEERPEASARFVGAFAAYLGWVRGAGRT